jgi:hypothetical protein
MSDLGATPTPHPTGYESQAIGRVIEALSARFPDVPAAVINDKVLQAREHFDKAPVREFVPVLVERQVRADLAGGNPTAAAA